jgi:hypothetical protein
MNFHWNKTDDLTPEESLDMYGALFVITDGEKLGLARWINDPFWDDPEDVIENYHFQVYGAAYAIPNFWMGPITCTIPLHTNQSLNNKVDHSQPPITEEKLKDPEEGTTRYRLTKVLGLSEDLAEKVLINSKDLSFDEVRQLLEVFTFLPISYSGTVLQLMCTKMVDRLEGQDGR